MKRIRKYIGLLLALALLGQLLPAAVLADEEIPGEGTPGEETPGGEIVTVPAEEAGSEETEGPEDPEITADPADPAVTEAPSDPEPTEAPSDPEPTAPVEPEVTEPEVTEPEATEPEATEPEVTEPEVTEPEATEPEATEPEATEPEVTEPEATEPEVTEPEATEPEATEPEATEPEVTEPEVTEPEVTEPESTEPEVTDPEVPAFVIQPQGGEGEHGEPLAFSWTFSVPQSFLVEQYSFGEWIAVGTAVSPYAFACPANGEAVVLRVRALESGVASEPFTLTWKPATPAYEFTSSPEGDSLPCDIAYPAVWSFTGPGALFFLETMEGERGEWVRSASTTSSYLLLPAQNGAAVICRVAAELDDYTYYSEEFTVQWDLPAPVFTASPTDRVLSDGTDAFLEWSFTGEGAVFYLETLAGDVWTRVEGTMQQYVSLGARNGSTLVCRVSADFGDETYTSGEFTLTWVAPTGFTVSPAGGFVGLGEDFRVAYAFSAPVFGVTAEELTDGQWLPLGPAGSGEVLLPANGENERIFRITATDGLGRAVVSEPFLVHWTDEPHFTVLPHGDTVRAGASLPLSWAFSTEYDAAVLETYVGGTWQALPESDVFTVSGEGRDGESAQYRVRVTAGEIDYFSDPFTVTWRVAPRFTLQPTGGRVESRADFPFDWAFNYPVGQVILQIYDSGWVEQGDVTENKIISGVFNSDRTYTYRLKALYEDEAYYSEEFTVTWDPVPAFIRQPMGGNCENGKSFTVPWSFSLTPDSAVLQFVLAGEWIDYDTADSPVVLTSTPDATMQYRIVVTYRGTRYVSNEFTVTWADAVVKYPVSAGESSYNCFSASLKEAPAGASVVLTSALTASNGATFARWIVTDAGGAPVPCEDVFAAETNFIMPAGGVTFVAVYVPRGEIASVELFLPHLTAGDPFPVTVAVPDGAGYRIVSVDRWTDLSDGSSPAGLIPHAGEYTARVSFTETNGARLGYYCTVFVDGVRLSPQVVWETSTVASVTVTFHAAEPVVTEPPTEEPTEPPTEPPTEAPTVPPTEPPTAAPTEAPTAAPTEAPTAAPTEAPTATPTVPVPSEPTAAPTAEPTAVPTDPADPGTTEPGGRSAEHRVPWGWILVCGIETLLLGAALIVIYLLLVDRKRPKPRNR